jgi:hypothetical protein
LPATICSGMGAEIDDDVVHGARVQRTSFTSLAGSSWKCIPRRVPARAVRNAVLLKIRL